MTDLKQGTKIKNRYTLNEFKGSGGFGEVWLAHDEVIDIDVAIKIYISFDSRGIEEFKKEHTTTQGLAHPNLLITTYFDIWENRPFLVMKYCAKGSCSAQIGKMDELTIWHFIHDVSNGLNYLHGLAQPIIHKDIKPENILIDENGNFLITDFGISNMIRTTMRKQSNHSDNAGALAYMGPERFERNSSAQKSSDIWALGVSIYELATGELPFNGLGGSMQRNGAELPELGHKWSKELNTIMQSCLAKEPWERPSAQQLKDFTKKIIEGKNGLLSYSTQIIDINSEKVSSIDNKKTLNIIIWISIVGILIVGTIIFILFNPYNKVEKTKSNNEITIEDYSLQSDTSQTNVPVLLVTDMDKTEKEEQVEDKKQEIENESVVSSSTPNVE